LQLKRSNVKPLFFVLSFLFLSCSRHFAQEKPAPQPFFVYHISADPDIDDPSFVVCDEKLLIPYYGGRKTSYQGEKAFLYKHFSAYQAPAKSAGQTGFITIRFIVNCKGKAGRFRMQQMDKDYQSFTFNKKITNQILALTKQLNAWIPSEYDKRAVDTYYYFCFQIHDGKLITITP
jgi:hypothetical protein